MVKKSIKNYLNDDHFPHWYIFDTKNYDENGHVLRLFWGAPQKQINNKKRTNIENGNILKLVNFLHQISLLFLVPKMGQWRKWPYI